MEHYTIEQIRSELEQKRGEPLTDDGFKLLLAGFRLKASRDRLYSRMAVYKAVQRGWMSATMAHFFKKYAGC